jgi:hypothetical protein
LLWRVEMWARRQGFDVVRHWVFASDCGTGKSRNPIKKPREQGGASGSLVDLSRCRCRWILLLCERLVSQEQDARKENDGSSNHVMHQKPPISARTPARA